MEIELWPMNSSLLIAVNMFGDNNVKTGGSVMVLARYLRIPLPISKF